MMKTFLIFMLMIYATAAQTLTLSGPTSVQPGGTVTLTVALAGSSGKNLSAAQWTVALPSPLTISSFASGAALSPVGKAVYCGALNQTCIFTGLTANVVSNNAAADGVVATITVAVPGSVSSGSTAIPLTGMLGADVTGSSIPVGSGPSYSIGILSKCDINADGVVDFKDVQAVVAGILGGACPAGVACNLNMLVRVEIAATGGSCSL